jgi:hypothetical protein
MDKIPDLLLVTYVSGSRPSIKLTPIEVKYRGSSIESTELLKSHLDQAASLGNLLDTMFTTLSANHSLWARASRAWLGAVLNHAFRIYSAPGLAGATAVDWSEAHGACLRELLAGSAAIEVVRAGKLLVFDLSESAAVDADEDGVLDTVRIGFQDSKAIVLSGNVRSPLQAMVHDVFGYRPKSAPDATRDGPGGGTGGAAMGMVPASRNATLEMASKRCCRARQERPSLGRPRSTRHARGSPGSSKDSSAMPTRSTEYLVTW